MGVHTGDSITVAPALTLTDKEYQRMRDASIAVLREIGVDTGGSNVQFAIDPADGRMVVIEMNPRVSRCSAPGVQGHGLPDRQGRGQARRRLHAGRDRERHHRRDAGLVRADDRLRRHQDPALHLREVPRDRAFAHHRDEVGGRGHGDRAHLQGIAAEGAARAGDRAVRPRRDRGAGPGGSDRPREAILAALARPTPDRLRMIAQAFREGLATGRDPGAPAPTTRGSWRRSRTSSRTEAALRRAGLPDDRARPARAQGATASRTRRLGQLTGLSEETRCARVALALGVRPVFKRIDTCAAEFAARTPYHLLLLRDRHRRRARGECESRPSDRRKVIILGGGPNRIGQGIEFDYCCVHAAFGLKEAGLETIMINCNPETVSTDPDTSDRLYFEPLTAEDVLEICRVEASRGELLGVIVQLGGQTPLKLATRWSRPASRSWAPRRTPSTSPRTASASSSCCTGWA